MALRSHPGRALARIAAAGNHAPGDARGAPRQQGTEPSVDSSRNETDRLAAAPAGLLVRVLRTFDGVAYLELDAKGCVRAANPSFARQVGIAAPDLVGRDAADLFPAQNAGMIRAWAAGADLPGEPQLVNFVSGTHQPFTLRCLVARHDRGLALVGEADAGGARATADQLMQLNNEFATVTRELTRRSRELEEAKAELSKALEELRTSYWHLQKIQEVLPVCMRCGRIRGDGATWQSVVEYLRSNDIFLSHGYCPECADATMRQYGLEDE